MVGTVDHQLKPSAKTDMVMKSDMIRQDSNIHQQERKKISERGIFKKLRHTHSDQLSACRVKYIIQS